MLSEPLHSKYNQTSLSFMSYKLSCTWSALVGEFKKKQKANKKQQHTTSKCELEGVAVTQLSKIHTRDNCGRPLQELF